MLVQYFTYSSPHNYAEQLRPLPNVTKSQQQRGVKVFVGAAQILAKVRSSHSENDNSISEYTEELAGFGTTFSTSHSP
jgi:hypothetical protein